MMKNNKGKKGILVTELQGIPSVLPKKHYVVLITQYFIFTLYFIIMSLWQGRGSIKVYWTKVQIIRDREERKFLKNINHQRGRKPGRLSRSLFIAVAVVQSLSCVRFLQPHGLQHIRLLCLPPSPGACSNSCPLNQ